MAWRIVKQPNGLFARFSDVVDDFTHYDMTEAEALEVCVQECDCGPKTAAEKVENAKRDLEPWTMKPSGGDGLNRWRDCLVTIYAVHGPARASEVGRTIGYAR